MKRNNGIILSLILVASIAGLVTGCGSNNPITPSVDSKIESILESAIAAQAESSGIPMASAAAYVRRNGGDYSGFAGTTIPNDTDWHFRASSTTMTFTSAAIMVLQQEELLNIDDKVTDIMPDGEDPYLPDTSDYDIPYKKDMTIRQLLQHRAGVFDLNNTVVPYSSNAPYAGQIYTEYVLEDNYRHQFSPDEFAAVLSSLELSEDEPGGRYRFSSTGYALLAKIIERVSGKSYSRYITETFLTPMTLYDTTLPNSGTDTILPDPSGGWFLVGDSFTDWYVGDGETYLQGSEMNPSPYIGDGNIVTTPRDLARWGWLLYGGRTEVDEESLEEIQANPDEGSTSSWYGLGCLKYANGMGYGHTGTVRAYMTVLAYKPSTDTSVVVVYNFLDMDDLSGQESAMIETTEKIMNLF